MRLSDTLLAWYDAHARDLPWRVPPGEARRPDPYHVWLSEVMLQQTTVAAVIPYFHRFLQRWPHVTDLAAAPQEEVMRLWAGLGYYARARNLHACAKAVAADGGFPETRDALRDLPGIGDYTSAAIAAIAFGERAAVVDGNVERVVTRLAADDTPLPAAKANVRAFMERETPAARPGDFAQAMMDLGATVCTPKSPSCLICPLGERCAAAAAGRATDYPVKPARKARPVRKGAAFVARRSDGAVWLTRRAPRGLLGGMAQVPTSDWSARRDGATGIEAAPFPAAWRHAGRAAHGFTHFEIELEVFAAEIEGATAGSIAVGGAGCDGWWSEDPAADGLPTLFRKVLNVAL